MKTLNLSQQFVIESSKQWIGKEYAANGHTTIKVANTSVTDWGFMGLLTVSVRMFLVILQILSLLNALTLCEKF
jgi:hypothetical protein